MINPEEIAHAVGALQSVADMVSRLDAGCCDPGRSPRMQRLADTVAATRASLERLGRNPSQADVALAGLCNAGEQVGWLQVGCCAPSRLPLYVGILEQLNTAQLSVNRARGTGH